MKTKKRFFYLSLAVFTLLVGVALYLCLKEYAIQETMPQSVRRATELLQTVAETPNKTTTFFFEGGGANEHLLPLLAARMGEFWRQKGDTQISVGTVYDSNFYKPQWSAQHYVERVVCTHRVGERLSVIWLDYHPKFQTFVPEIWIDGITLTLPPSAKKTP